jgi:hypothetical protein
MKKISIIACLVMGLFVVNSADALLVDNYDGTVTQYRNDGSVLMWMQDANYALTSGYCSISGNCDQNIGSGTMSWYRKLPH